MKISNNGKEYKSVAELINDWSKPNREALKELIEAVIVSIDLHGIDVIKQYPNLWEMLKRLEKE